MSSALYDLLAEPAFQDYQRSLCGVATDKIALMCPPFAGITGADMARQLKGQATAEHKIPTWADLPAIAYPPSANLAQSSSEAMARFKAWRLTGRAVADLTGGAGVDAWFVREHAKGILHNEPDTGLSALATHNLGLAPGPAQAASSQRAAEDFTAQDLQEYDAILLDPSRRDEGGNRAWRWDQMRPHLPALGWLWQSGKQILLKLSPGTDLAEAQRNIPRLSRFWVLALGNEVKELLAETDAGDSPTPAQVPVLALDLDWQGRCWWAATDELPEGKAKMAERIGPYLLEPAAAVLKANLQDRLALVHNLAKLAVNTHLYTSGTLPEEFFGRSYRVLAQLPAQAQYIHTWLAGRGCQISARNFGAEPEQIRKRYKLKAGDGAQLYFTQGPQGHVCLVITRIEI